MFVVANHHSLQVVHLLAHGFPWIEEIAAEQAEQCEKAEVLAAVRGSGEEHHRDDAVGLQQFLDQFVAERRPGFFIRVEVVRFVH